MRRASPLPMAATGKPVKNAALLQKALKDVDLAYQNLESVELGVTSVDHYFDTLGGIARAVKRARGGAGDAGLYRRPDPRRGQGPHAARPDRAGNPVAQPEPEVLRGAAEARRRRRAPDRGACDQHAGLVGHHQAGGPLGLSAPVGNLRAGRGDAPAAGRPEPRSLAPAWPNRLLEASDRNYWQPDAATLAALQGAADELEDRLEGIAAE